MQIMKHGPKGSEFSPVLFRVHARAPFEHLDFLISKGHKYSIESYSNWRGSVPSNNEGAMCIAHNSKLTKIRRLIRFFLVAAWLSPMGCGRSFNFQKGIFSDSGVDNLEGIDEVVDAGISAPQASSVTPSTTTGPITEPIVGHVVDASLPRPTYDAVDDGPFVDASSELDAATDSASDGAVDSSESVETCEKDTDCKHDNQSCEIPICSSSGICTNELLEDGTQCSESSDYRICVGGICKMSYCGDGFVDTNMGEMCDDDNWSDSDDCVNCMEATCGDGYLHETDEECEPSLDINCGQDCKLSKCGDGVVTLPIENCEPSIDGSACNEECRLSDKPQWKMELYTFNDDILSVIGSFLLLDSAGQPIVITMETYTDDSNISKGITLITKYSLEGEQLWQWASDEQDLPLSPTLDTNDSIQSVYPFGAAIDANDQVLISGSIIVSELSEKTLPWLLKINAEGQFIWSTTIDKDQYGLHSVAVDNQSNIMALMSSLDAVSPSLVTVTDPTIELFSPDGIHRVDNSVETSGYFNYRGGLHSGMVGDTSSFILSGSRQTSSRLATFMALLDSDGQMIWDSPVVYTDENQDVSFIQAKAAADGDIVVLGAYNSYINRGPYTSPNDFWFARYTPAGSARYEEIVSIRSGKEDNSEIVNASDYIPAMFFPMDVNQDNNVFFANPISASPSYGSAIIVDKYDSEGKFVWERPLHYETGLNYLHVPIEIAVNEAGSIFVLDWLTTGDSESIWLYRWDEELF